MIVLALTWTSFLHYATVALWFVVFWAGLGAIVWYAERRARERPAERKLGGRGWTRGEAGSQSTQYSVPSTQYSVPSTQYSVPSTQNSVLSTKYSSAAYEPTPAAALPFRRFLAEFTENQTENPRMAEPMAGVESSSPRPTPMPGARRLDPSHSAHWTEPLSLALRRARSVAVRFARWFSRTPLAWPALWLMWRVRLRYGPDAIWDPFNLDAWYYGHAPRLRQSLVLLVGYMLQFCVLFALFGMAGCKLFYEMPVGGGGPHQTIAQQVQIQKVIRKKFVINPLSSIIFNPPPIEEVKLELKELTQNRYEVGGGNAPGVGAGQGDAAGYGAGTRFGRVRFIRIRYDGGDWDQDMGIGADLNMLLEYGLRTRQKVAEATEAVTIEQLGRFDRLYSPPFVYLTGAGSISVSRSQVKTLRDYLLKHHGMIFADNGGTSHWHNQFVALMRQVLPDVREVAIPLDDPIHRVPYAIPSLPYVAPHGGTEALGWKVQGRWAAYYHPGDIGDAWKDDHAGVPAEVVEQCYRLGVNVIHYSHAEYSQWVLSQRK